MGCGRVFGCRKRRRRISEVISGSIEGEQMPHWLIKSAIHRAISFLPRSDRWNELQKTLPWVLPERMARVREALREAKTQKPESLLASLNIHALVRDASRTELAGNSIDFFPFDQRSGVHPAPGSQADVRGICAAFN